MSRSSGFWVIPYFIAAVMWMMLYKRADSIAKLYLAGRENPIIFVLIIGMFFHVIFGLIREWRRS